MTFKQEKNFLLSIPKKILTTTNEKNPGHASGYICICMIVEKNNKNLKVFTNITPNTILKSNELNNIFHVKCLKRFAFHFKLIRR